MPTTRSATGGAFLGFLPTQTTRRRGFARTSEFIPGIAGMAAPVFDHTGAMSLALVALGYSKPFDTAFE